MKKTILLAGLALLILLALFSLRFILGGDEDTWLCEDGQWVRHGQPSSPEPVGGCGPQAVINNFTDCLEAGYPIMESYPRQCRTASGDTFTEDIGNELDKTDLIMLDSPRPNQPITSPLELSGQARGPWFFEASFPVKIYDDNGWLLGQIPAQAEGDWMTEDFVGFKARLNFAVPTTPRGSLVLAKDNPSGLLENADELNVPVNFEEASEVTQEKMTVEMYLSDLKYVNEPFFDCSRTFAVERQVPKSQTVDRAALRALLRGATLEEVGQGYDSNINPGTRVKNLVIEDGIAKVDFDQQLEFQVGGSCRTAAIRAQITDTLLQFPTVDSVIISIDGRSEDILQP